MKLFWVVYWTAILVAWTSMTGMDRVLVKKVVTPGRRAKVWSVVARHARRLADAADLRLAGAIRDWREADPLTYSINRPDGTEEVVGRSHPGDEIIRPVQPTAPGVH